MEQSYTRLQTALAVVMLLLTPFFWAGHSLVGRIIANDIPPFSLVSFRWSLAAAIFAPFVIRKVWPERRLLLRHWRYVVITGLIGPAAFPCFLYLGLQTTTVTNTSIIQTTVPALVPLFAWAALRERVTWAQAGGIALSMVGVTLIIGRGDFSALANVNFVIGDLYILAGFTVWSLYTVAIRMKPQGMSPNTLLLSSMIVGALATMPIWVWDVANGRTIPITPDVSWAIAYIIVFPTLLAYYFYNQSIAILGPTKAGLASHLVPPIGILLGVIFLNEQLAPFHAISFALIAAGVFIVIRSGRPAKSRAPS